MVASIVASAPPLSALKSSPSLTLRLLSHDSGLSYLLNEEEGLVQAMLDVSALASTVLPPVVEESPFLYRFLCRKLAPL